MNKHAGLFTGQPPDFDEFVSKASPCFCFADDLLELDVEEFIAALPVNVGSDLREEEVNELGEIGFERQLPGRIEVVRDLLFIKIPALAWRGEAAPR
jgi:hypothetical protein